MVVSDLRGFAYIMLLIGFDLSWGCYYAVGLGFVLLFGVFLVLMVIAYIDV